jgi:hypothetical protein
MRIADKILLFILLVLLAWCVGMVIAMYLTPKPLQQPYSGLIQFTPQLWTPGIGGITTSPMSYPVSVAVPQLPQISTQCLKFADNSTVCQ